MVSPEDHRRLSDCRRSGKHGSRGRRRFGSFFFDLDERLVHDGRNRQVAVPVIPEKSASPGLNAAGIPSADKASRSSHSAVSLNRGRLTSSRCDDIFVSHPSILAGVSDLSRSASPSFALGKRTTIASVLPL